jgi:hypothetical protein
VNPGIGTSFPELNIPRSTIRSWIHRGTTCVHAVIDNDSRRILSWTLLPFVASSSSTSKPTTGGEKAEPSSKASE